LRKIILLVPYFDQYYINTMRLRILVTGSRGLLGATLMRSLEHNGFDVIGLAADIRDEAAAVDEVQRSDAAWVIHTAALTNVGACELNPDEARRVNVGGTAHVLKGAQRSCTRIMYISTASVFGGDSGDYTEDDVPDPVNVYNNTKYEGEQLIGAYEKGMILRLNLVGIHPDGSRGKNFLEWLLDSVRANRDLALFSDACINPLSNWTVAQLIKKIIKSHSKNKILHIGSRDVLSKADIGKMLVQKFPGYKGTIKADSVDTVPDGVWRPKQMWLNTDLATKLFGPMPMFEHELAKAFGGALD
jgi:dTDP-4-dehydrorhamnose reductase